MESAHGSSLPTFHINVFVATIHKGMASALKSLGSPAYERPSHLAQTLKW